jgi:hypothetical protein
MVTLTKQTIRDPDKHRARLAPEPRRNLLDNVVSSRGRSLFEADGYGDEFPQPVTRHGHSRSLGNTVVEVDGVLDLLGGDVLTPTDDDVLDF